MAAVMKALSVPFVDKVDDKAYTKDFERTVGRVMIGGGALDFGQAVSLALNLLRDHGLRLDPNLTLAIKALMQAQAIATLLFPAGGIVEDGVQIIKEEALKVVTADKILDTAKKQVVAAAREAAGNLPSLSDATAKLAEPVSQGALRGLRGHLWRWPRRSTKSTAWAGRWSSP
jgi:predicted unusual protein kinase regulating ubiquinone biosynthesis (AarF/ABC1/UbiB family)